MVLIFALSGAVEVLLNHVTFHGFFGSWKSEIIEETKGVVGKPAASQAVPGEFHKKGRMVLIADVPCALLKRFGLLERFEFVLDSTTVGWKKPGRLLYEASLAHAGCDAGEATFVGDNLRNDVLAPLALVSKATTSAAGAPQYPLGFERSQAGRSSVRSTDVHLVLWLQFCLRMSENYPISHTTFTHVLQIATLQDHR